MILPYAVRHHAAFILGIGRAINEVMAVLMVTENSRDAFHYLGYCVPSPDRAELGEAPFGALFQALFTLGIILLSLPFDKTRLLN